MNKFRLLMLRLLCAIFSIIFSACSISTNPSDNPGNGGTTSTSLTDIKSNGSYAFMLTDAETVYSAFLLNSSSGSSIVHERVAGLKDIRKIAAAPANNNSGHYEGLALDKNGNLFTINMNITTGKPDSALAFTQSSAFGGAVITDIAAGGDGSTIFFLALTQNGNVYGWGNNGNSLYGIYAGTVPQPISGLNNIAAVSAGVNQALALTASGNVYNWGVISRQDNEKYPNPTLVIGASPASAIDAGDNYNIAKRSDGSVYAWGHLMDGVVPGISSPAKISAGAETYFNPMFVAADGTLWKTSFSMSDGSPQLAERVTGLGTSNFKLIDISRLAFYYDTAGKLLIQSSAGTAPYILDNPHKKN